jgi:uncharacterized protein (UPF0264 family)
LLVSVRDAGEAEAALAGGADVIDVKEPARGSLGAADAAVVAAVVSAVAGRAPISFAAGELVEWSTGSLQRYFAAIGGGAAYCKFGLAGCRAEADWLERWRQAAAMLGGGIQPVAVAYADWPAAAAPPPDQILCHAAAIGCAALLVDTWDKQRGTLLDHWSVAEICAFGQRVRDARMSWALAGSLAGSQLAQAAECRPALVAVRGAACDGGRNGRVSAARVAIVRAAVDGRGVTSCCHSGS